MTTKLKAERRELDASAKCNSGPNPLIAYQRDPLDRRLIIQAHPTRRLGKQKERPGKMAINLPGPLKSALVATKPPSAF